MFDDWKTTITALVSAVAILLAQLHIVTISNETQIAIVTIAMFIIGLFTNQNQAVNVITDNEQVNVTNTEEK